MGIIRVLDWSIHAPALPEKQPPLPGMPQKLLQLDGVIIRDGAEGRIGHCIDCGVRFNGDDEWDCRCEECLEFIDDELRAKHEED